MVLVAGAVVFVLAFFRSGYGDSIAKRRRASHFNARFQERSDLPCHVWLALPHAEPAVRHRDMDHRCPLVTTAGLEALGIARLVDVKACIIRFNGDDEIHRPHCRRNLATQIDGPITGIAGQ